MGKPNSAEVKQREKKPQLEKQSPVSQGAEKAAGIFADSNLPFSEGTAQSQVALLGKLPNVQKQSALQRIAQVQGNRHAQQIATSVTSSSTQIPSVSRAASVHTGTSLQAKLTVSEPGDELELEADNVAEQVLRMPMPLTPPPGDGDDDNFKDRPSVLNRYLQRSPIQRAEDGIGGNVVDENVQSRIDGMQRGGQPLPESERNFFESRMGVDLGGVRVHTDSTATETSKDLNARAYTVGSHVAFNSSEYQPGTTAGRRLLAHELTHVVQQGGAGSLQRTPQPKVNRCADASCQLDAGLMKAQAQRALMRDPAEVKSDSVVSREPNRCTTPGCAKIPRMAIQRKVKPVEHAEATAVNPNPDLASEQAPKEDKTATVQAPGESRVQGVGSQAPSRGLSHDDAPQGGEPQGGMPQGGEPQGPSPQDVASAGGEQAPQEPAPSEVQKGEEETETVKAEDIATGEANPMVEAVQAAAPEDAKEGIKGQGQAAKEATEQADAEKQEQQDKPAEAQALQDMTADVEPGAPDEMTAAATESQTQRDAAQAKAASAEAALQETVARISELAGAEIAFADPEEAMSAPGGTPVMRSEGGGEDIQARLQRYRTEDAALASTFMSNATGRVQAITDLGSTATPRVQAAAEAAKTQISSTMQAQVELVRGYIEQARMTAETEAEATRQEITTQHKSAVAAIQDATTTARGQLDVTYNAAIETVLQYQDDELARLDTTYEDADRKYREAGVTVGGEAVQAGEEKAQTYLGQKINRKDSFLDGYLTDRRCEARAKAAREVAGQYQSGLVDAANEQAGEAMKGKPQDQETIRTNGDQIREALEAQYQAAMDNLAASEEQAISQAEETQTQLLTSVDDTLAAIIETVGQQETSQTEQLSTLGEQQAAAMDQASAETAAKIQEGVTAAASSLQGAISSVQGALNGAQVPEPASLAGALDSAMGQIDAGVGQVQGSIEQGVAAAEQSLMEKSTQAAQMFVEMGASAMAEVDTLLESMTTSFEDLKAGAAESYAGIQEQHITSTGDLLTAVSDSFTQVTDQAKTVFEQLGTNVETSLSDGEQRLLEGLRGAVRDDMPPDIEAAAEDAAAKEQPAWKGILKIVLIIAIIVVVALVIGPAVIGAVGAAAGALGASAATASAVGAIVGGAIVGAMTAAAITMTGNVIDGRPIMEGVAQAAIMGAIGGALGGAVGLAVGNLASSLGSKIASEVGRKAMEFGMNLVADVVVDVGLEVLMTGEFSWASLGVAIVSSLLMSGVGEIGFVKNIQSRSMDFGSGMFDGTPTPRVDVDGTPGGTRPDIDVDVDGTPGGMRPDVDADGMPGGTHPDVDADGTPGGTHPDVDADSTPGGPRPDLDDTQQPMIDEDAAHAHAVSETEDGKLILDDGSVVQCNGACKLELPDELPDAPKDHHWYRNQDGSYELRRNPNTADTTTPIKYDPENPMANSDGFVPSVKPPEGYEWTPKQDGTFELTGADGAPPIEYDPSTGLFNDTSTGKPYVNPDAAGGSWPDHTYGDPSVNPCFIPGTPVQTPNGPVSIESLSVGDLVYGYDFSTETVVKTPVLVVYESRTKSLIDIQLGNTTITATRQHRFWVESEGDWLAAAALEPGMTVRLHNGETLSVESVKVYHQNSATHNLEIAQVHTYYVGNVGVLVHNGGGGESNFADTTPKNAKIYIIKDIDGNVIYIGKTTQDTIDQRFQQHLSDKPDWRERYDAGMIQDPELLHGGQWTDYETAVWEKHFIDEYHQAGSPLENDMSTPPISEEKYNQYKHLHSPCTE